MLDLLIHIYSKTINTLQVKLAELEPAPSLICKMKFTIYIFFKVLCDRAARL